MTRGRSSHQGHNGATPETRVFGSTRYAFASEMRFADRNRTIAYLMLSSGMIGDDVEENLALYLRQCSVCVTSRDLALMAATLANGGKNPMTGEWALDHRYVRTR